MQTLAVLILAILSQQYIQLADGVTCATNPCNLATGFDGSTGYCCYDVPPNYIDVVCTCPNNVPSVLNAPCRASTSTGNQAFCNRTCVNNGVCNIVNGEEVCWCQLGFSGSNCELQGIPVTCASNVCQVGTCIQQTIGASTFSYCQCNPGWTGTTCSLSYFTCSATGVFPDTAYCALGRYFLCTQASGAPISATCPKGQKFNASTKSCDINATC